MMDLFQTLLVAVIAAFSILCTGFILFVKLRQKFAARVNCWFCNKNTKVPYECRNSWNCPYCEQYNGFSSDGGYNKTIPAQHESHLNHRTTTFNKRAYCTPVSNRFCRSCTINQKLKIQQLASFVPIDNDNFEEEIEQYRIHLERAYALCTSCESVLKDTLTRQRVWLLGLRTKEKCQSYLKGRRIYSRLLAVAHSNVHLARVLSLSVCTLMLMSVATKGDYLQMPVSVTTMLSSLSLPICTSELLLEWLLLCHQSKTLSAVGMVFQAVATLGMRISWHTFDLYATAGWAVLHVQCWLAAYLPMKDLIDGGNIEVFHVVMMLITLTFCLLPFLVSRVSKSTLRKIPSDSMKRLNTSPYATPNNLMKGRSDNLTRNEYLNFKIDSSHFANNSSSKRVPQETMCNTATPNCADNSQNCKQRLCDKLHSNASSISGAFDHPHSAKFNSTEMYFERDLHRGLGSLSLGTGPRPRNRRWAFETRVYSCKEFPGLFTATDNRPRPLLSPPRFGVHKNVTRSPWSAGGYWQTAASFADGLGSSPLSRSSSRSSGFGSLSSRAAAVYDTAAAASPPGSCAGSVCAGDADCFSVHSLPAYPPNFSARYFPFYGTPYLVPHMGGYAVASPYCFSPPVSPSPQSSPASSDSDSSCISQKGNSCCSSHKSFIDILRGNAWLSFMVGSSILLNAAAAAFFIFTNYSHLIDVS